MPAVRTVPKTSDFLAAWENGLRDERGIERNARRGGVYDLANGPTALLWAQEATRDRDLFRACCADTASDQDLDRIVSKRYRVSRVQDAYGTGTALLRRLSGGSSGTIYEGTRIEIVGAGPFPSVYAASADVAVGAADTTVAIPIRATRTGAGTAAKSSSGLRITDELFDPSFVPVSLVCADGTDRELDAVYLARGRANLPSLKVGTVTAIANACAAVGAANVVILDANVFGDALDFGSSCVYVADAGFGSPPALLDAAAVAIEDARIEGCDVQVLGMTNTPVTDLSIAVTLSDVPGRFDLVALTETIVSAEIDEFEGRSDFWTWSLSTARAVALRATGDAAREIVVSSAQAPGPPSFVPVLPRYTLSGTAIRVSFSSPG